MKREPIITIDEVKKCVALLHKDYRDCEIHIFYSKLSFLKWCLKVKFFDTDQIKKVLKGKTAGYYRYDRNHAHIYLFSHKVPERYFKLNVIHTVFHEVRHYYQRNYQKNKWSGNRGVSYGIGDYRYKSAPVERDANKFAARMAIKHREEISKILNVYPDWTVNGYE